MHLEIKRSDIREFRTVPTAMSTPLQAGHVLMRLERFALTSNNVSYALGGDALDYWGFFPTEDGWGRLPAMGFGIVEESAQPGIEVGDRYFGFFPVGDHHVVHAQPTSGGFVDVAPHRDTHAMAYRSFDKVSNDHHPDDDAYLVLRGLFVTSYLAEDFLRDNNMFGATQMLITSASSKTSIALAQQVRVNASAHAVALTSAGNVDFTNNVGLYDSIITYDDIESLDPTVPTVLVDMAGNASVIARVHTHFGDALKYSCRIGATHWDQLGSGATLDGPKPIFFFAPHQLAKRGKEWGRTVLNERMDSALAEFVSDSPRWLHIEHGRGAEAVTTIYNELVSGNIRPEAGNILSY
jgi:Protein of unknown function (DUF2855)